MATDLKLRNISDTGDTVHALRIRMGKLEEDDTSEAEPWVSKETHPMRRHLDESDKAIARLKSLLTILGQMLRRGPSMTAFIILQYGRDFMQLSTLLNESEAGADAVRQMTDVVVGIGINSVMTEIEATCIRITTLGLFTVTPSICAMIEAHKSRGISVSDLPDGSTPTLIVTPA